MISVFLLSVKAKTPDAESGAFLLVFLFYQVQQNYCATSEKLIFGV